jgi:hypothetical protein
MAEVQGFFNETCCLKEHLAVCVEWCHMTCARLPHGATLAIMAVLDVMGDGFVFTHTVVRRPSSLFTPLFHQQGPPMKEPAQTTS